MKNNNGQWTTPSTTTNDCCRSNKIQDLTASSNTVLLPKPLPEMHASQIFHLLMVASPFLFVSSFFSHVVVLEHVRAPTELSTRRTRVKALNDAYQDETFDPSSYTNLSRRELLRRTSQTSVLLTTSSLAVVGCLTSNPSPVIHT